MADDEIAVGIFACVLCLLGWGSWYVGVLRPRTTGPGAGRGILALAPLAALIAILLVQRTLASADVRGDWFWIGWYGAFCMAWAAVLRVPWFVLGLCWRADALERRNGATAIAAVGALLGGAMTVTGATIGDGPGWWCVAVAGGLASGTWLLAWLLLELIATPRRAVSIDRCPAAGLRLGSFLLAAGLICGRGAAGDWHGFAATVDEFQVAWPMLPLLFLAIVWERVQGPTPDHPQRPAMQALPAALGYLAIAMIAWWLAGPVAPEPPAVLEL